jgi:hypothetical protein
MATIVKITPRQGKTKVFRQGLLASAWPRHQLQRTPMREPNTLSVPKWPFYLGDLFLVAAAIGIYLRSGRPMTSWEMAAVAMCTGLAAICGMLPHILEFKGQVKLTDSNSLLSAMNQLSKLESISAQISGATGQWQNIHGESEKTAEAARQI